MAQRRDTYRYHVKVGKKIVYRGITNDLERREREHQQIWPNATVKQQGPRVTRKTALKWEREGGKGLR